MQYHEYHDAMLVVSCSIMQYHEYHDAMLVVSCSIMQYHEYHVVSCSIMQYHEYHVVSCSIMSIMSMQYHEYHVVSCSIMQYHDASMRHHKSTKIHLKLRKRSISSTCANIPGLNVRKCVIFQLQLSLNFILVNEHLFLEVTVQLYSNIHILGLNIGKFTFFSYSCNF